VLLLLLCPAAFTWMAFLSGFAPLATFHVFALFLLRNTFTLLLHMCQIVDWLFCATCWFLQDVPIQEPNKELLLWEPNCAGRDDHWWIL
jgi:hypothetical protein